MCLEGEKMRCTNLLLISIGNKKCEWFCQLQLIQIQVISSTGNVACSHLDRSIGIYINKVAVCLFVCLSGTFSFTIVMITQVLVQTFTTRGKTTNSITYFCVTITQVLVQTYTTRRKQQLCYSFTIPTRTGKRLAPLKF